MKPDSTRTPAVLLILTSLAALAAYLLPIALAEEKADFARWEKDIAAFEKQDRDRPPPKNAVLFVGSSSIRLWDLPRSFPETEVINRGFGGSHLADAAHFAPRLVVKYEPRLVVLYAGDNDIAAGKSPEQVAADFRDFAGTVRKGLPKARILFLSIKPSPRRWALREKVAKANALIEAQCKQDEGLLYLDVATPLLGKDGRPRPELFREDDLHLNARGYELWASVLGPHLK
jgi:lysophospholipase L1-like esterase